eukprot:scaffold893_cov336-Prasinococcus_capsulatus_cf.AAC.9
MLGNHALKNSVRSRKNTAPSKEIDEVARATMACFTSTSLRGRGLAICSTDAWGPVYVGTHKQLLVREGERIWQST